MHLAAAPPPVLRQLQQYIRLAPGAGRLIHTQHVAAGAGPENSELGEPNLQVKTYGYM